MSTTPNAISMMELSDSELVSVSGGEENTCGYGRFEGDAWTYSTYECYQGADSYWGMTGGD